MKIHSWVEIVGVMVPYSAQAQVLDWEDVVGETAPRRHCPEGAFAFRIGDESRFFILDYVVLPDGNFDFDLDECGFDSGLTAREDGCLFWARDEAVEQAFRLCERAQVLLGDIGVEHDEDWADRDAWAFMRAVGRAAGLDGYRDADEAQIRYGLGPVVQTLAPRPPRRRRRKTRG